MSTALKDRVFRVDPPVADHPDFDISSSDPDYEMEERSDELLNILSKTPSWILRWGNTSFLVLLLSFVAISGIIKYPDTIDTRIFVVTSNPPVSIISKLSAELEKLYVTDHSDLHKGDVIGIFKSTANYEDLLSLKTFIQKEIPTDSSLIESLKLGEVSGQYEAYIRSVKDLDQFKMLNFHQSKIQQMQESLGHHFDLLEQQEKKLNLMEKEVKVASGIHQKNKRLYHKKAMTMEAYHHSEIGLIQKRTALESAKEYSIQSKLKIQNILHTISDLKRDSLEKVTNLLENVKASKRNLLTAISQWENNHVLKSPINGTITYLDYWNENQFVQAGDEVFTILPHDTTKVIGRLVLPLNNSGKVKTGQEVTVKLDGFPYKEFGMLKGKISSISLAPKNQAYIAEVEFPNNLTTTYKKKLSLKQKMTGDASVITEELSLLERFFYQFKDILDNKISD